MPVVNVANDPTRFQHDPRLGLRGTAESAFRDLRSVNEDEKLFAVILKFADRFLVAHGSTPLGLNLRLTDM
jgi:hypothetical protein